MISNPKHGWCSFNMGNFEGNPSYLTDVPLDLLDAFINYFKIGYGVVVFDEEGTSFTLVLEKYNSNIFIIEEREERLLHIFDDLVVKNLVEELVDDVENDIDKWSDFITSDNVEDIQHHKEDLIQRLGTLKKLFRLNFAERIG